MSVRPVLRCVRNPDKTDDLDASGRTWRGRTRLRALWTVWSVVVRVHSSAPELRYSNQREKVPGPGPGRGRCPPRTSPHGHCGSSGSTGGHEARSALETLQSFLTNLHFVWLSPAQANPLYFIKCDDLSHLRFRYHVIFHHKSKSATHFVFWYIYGWWQGRPLLAHSSRFCWPGTQGRATPCLNRTYFYFPARSRAIAASFGNGPQSYPPMTEAMRDLERYGSHRVDDGCSPDRLPCTTTLDLYRDLN